MTTATILLVEDEREVRSVIRMQLEPLYEVVEAPNGRVAWETIQGIEPDLVITDLAMPGVDGLELTDRIKNHETLGGTPVIILTGVTQGDDLPPEFWRKGTKADVFLEKPFDPEKLRFEIDRLLKARVNYRPLPPGKGYYD